jgi:hypothetical protein
MNRPTTTNRTFLQVYQDRLAAYIVAGAAQLDSVDSFEVMAYVVVAAKQPALTALVVGQALWGAYQDGFGMGSKAARNDVAFYLYAEAQKLTETPPIESPTLPDEKTFRAYVGDILKAVYEAGIKAGQAANESAHSQPAMSASA